MYKTDLTLLLLIILTLLNFILIDKIIYINNNTIKNKIENKSIREEIIDKSYIFKATHNLDSVKIFIEK